MSYNSAGTVQYRVRTNLILAIRNAFINHPRYPYIELPNGEFDYTNSQIFISDVTPIDYVAYPYVVVDTLPANEDRYLGPDMLWDTSTVAGLTYAQTVNFTSIPLTANIKIYTRDTITRDNLISAIYDTLKINKDILAMNGVEIISTQWQPETREFLMDRWWYVSTISMYLYAEWSTVTQISIISDVSLTTILIPGVTISPLL
jgi:hypothetical protein